MFFLSTGVVLLGCVFVVATNIHENLRGSILNLNLRHDQIGLGLVCDELALNQESQDKLSQRGWRRALGEDQGHADHHDSRPNHSTARERFGGSVARARIFVLDDFSALRKLTPATLAQEGTLFAVGRPAPAAHIPLLETAPS
jgi:hypothetical protein